MLAAPRRLWPRRARGPLPVGLADHAADFWLGAGHDPSAGDELSHTRVSCAAQRRMHGSLFQRTDLVKPPPRAHDP